MSTKDISHKINEAFNSHDAFAIASFYAEDAVVYDPFYPEPLRGRAMIEKDMTEFFTAFPDIHSEIRNILEGDNLIAFENLINGTNDGVLATPDGEIPPTGKKVTMDVAIFSKFNEEGLIIEDHRYYNIASLMKQLGIGDVRDVA